MKRLVLLLALCCLGFTGCEQPAQMTVKNGDFDLELLFEVDGCRMYRFHDGGSARYFLTPTGITIRPVPKSAPEIIGSLERR